MPALSVAYFETPQAVPMRPETLPAESSALLSATWKVTSMPPRRSLDPFLGHGASVNSAPESTRGARRQLQRDIPFLSSGYSPALQGSFPVMFDVLRQGLDQSLDVIGVGVHADGDADRTGNAQT